MRSTGFFFSVAAAAALTLPINTAPAFAQDAPPPAQNAVLPAITVSAAETRVLRDRVIASGLVRPVEEVQITPMVQGQQVAALLADVGQTVTAGQVIAQLSTSPLPLQLAEIETALTAANAAGDTAAAAQLQSALEVVLADLARAELTIKRTDVKSPVSGEIATRSAELGAMAGATGAPMFTIIRDGLLELQADVAESDLVRLAAGQIADLVVVGGGDALSGKVRLVEPTINAQTRLGRVRVSFDDSRLVRAGMFVEAAILVAERETLAVPVTAVGRYEGAPSVMIISKDGIAERRMVQTGIRDGGWIEITQGLQAGETVVTKAGAFVRAGDAVNPVMQTATLAN
jgi:HlyD family secretion protein